MHIQNLIKIHPFVLKIEEKHIFRPTKGHNSVVYKRIQPISTPKPPSLISISMPSLKQIGQKLLKLESGNEALTDGQTVRRVLHNTPPLFVWWGIKHIHDKAMVAYKCHPDIDIRTRQFKTLSLLIMSGHHTISISGNESYDDHWDNNIKTQHLRLLVDLNTWINYYLDFGAHEHTGKPGVSMSEDARQMIWSHRVYIYLFLFRIDQLRETKKIKQVTSI